MRDVNLKQKGKRWSEQFVRRDVMSKGFVGNSGPRASVRADNAGRDKSRI